ncbi:hypothetical protein H0H92_000433 [Tricholoma furcatifolium]|nr:hypothetical protein H0H92_000433 [Tricholoma furcatifolium]
MDTSAHSLDNEQVAQRASYGRKLAVFQFSEKSSTLSEAEFPLTTKTYCKELKQHRAPITRGPPSRTSVLGAAENTVNHSIVAHTHPVMRYRSSSLCLEAPEPVHIICTPVDSRLTIDSTTPLPSYHLPTSPEKPLTSLRFVKNRTCASIRADISCVSFRYLRQLYHIIFLGFPLFYQHRVHRIFKEVWLSKDDLMEHIIATLAEEQARLEARGQPLSSAAYYVRAEDAELSNLKTLWESFVDQSLREWKMTNFVSILLPSAMIGTLQISEAVSDVIVRTSVLMSLEGERTQDHIFWNTWVLLSMPVTWLSWSLIFYTVGITSFIWRAGSGRPAPTIEMGLGSRIAITCLLWIGIIYFVLIIFSLNEYGERMDVAWRDKVRQVAAERNIMLKGSFDGHSS